MEMSLSLGRTNVFDVDPIDSQVILKRKETDVECDMKRQGSYYSLLIILHVPWQGSGPQPSTEILTFGLIHNQVYWVHES